MCGERVCKSFIGRNQLGAGGDCESNINAIIDRTIKLQRNR